jgi:hypothetical protein
VRRRRSTTEASSFDLFLDTISNTFGGIVFIAILLALMIQTRSVVKMDQESTKIGLTDDEYQSRKRELESITEELLSAKSRLASFQPAQRDFDDSELQELRASNLVILTEINQLESQINDFSLERDAIDIKRTELQSHAEELKALPIDQLQQSIAEQQEKYELIYAQNRPTVLVPQERLSGNLIQYWVLVKNNRLFIAGTETRDSDFRQGVSLGHVEVKPRATLNESTIITPIAGEGFDLTSSSGRKKVQELVQQLRPDDDKLTVAIWPDSFHHFDYIQQWCIDTRIAYYLGPMNDETKLSLKLTTESFQQ